MDQEYITNDSLSGENDVPSVNASSDESMADSTVSSDTVEQLSLAELNEYLGKNYKDKATAIKSIKDTFRYVGQKAAPQPSASAQAIDPSRFISREQYETDMFYSKNPEYEQSAIRDVIDSMAKSQGKKPSDVVNTENFKAIFSKVRGYDESQSVRSVLETNPRMVGSKDNFAKAQEAMKSGDKNTAEDLATRAVMEAYSK